VMGGKSSLMIRDLGWTFRILFLITLFQFFGLKILKFFDAYPDTGSGILLALDPGSRMEKIRSGIRDKHPEPQHCFWECGATQMKQQSGYWLRTVVRVNRYPLVDKFFYRQMYIFLYSRKPILTRSLTYLALCMI
jgi:hypothetical protein